LNCDPPDLYLLSSRIIGTNHQCLAAPLNLKSDLGTKKKYIQSKTVSAFKEPKSKGDRVGSQIDVLGKPKLSHLESSGKWVQRKLWKWIP
jgi:hypothetical protein